MDLTANVAALEEEVTLLKGEIKLILQEVRTAILTRENPFTLASMEAHAMPMAITSIEAHAMPSSHGNERANERDMSPVREPEPHKEPEEPKKPAPEPTPLRQPSGQKEAQKPVEERYEAPRPARMDVPMLAALVTWTQEMAERHSNADLSIVLSLARYGGLIEGDLEATLGKIGKAVAAPSDKMRAGIGDILLALRQLEALIGSDSMDAQPYRKAG